ncbi:MAG: hypothetical protein D6781_09605 [Verrucomicrobia bacterium]|nr:MAG: hypothetical protein D6781_09605 [Verrucomicrobiota bacterium]
MFRPRPPRFGRSRKCPPVCPGAVKAGAVGADYFTGRCALAPPRSFSSVSNVRIRIVSDLHYAEHGSRLRRLDALAPLFDGVDRVVFNGDTLETRFLDVDAHTRERKAEFEAWAAPFGDRLIIISGNHDPDFGAHTYLELAAGAVLVTHGDIMFPEMAPWGWEARWYREEQARLLAAEPAQRRHSLDTRLAVCKRAILNIRDLSPRYPLRSSHPWKRRLRFLWSLRRVDEILKAWRRTPAAAAAIAETYRPEARVVVVGHTHRPGAWLVRGRHVINTGSLVPPLGALAVDIDGDRLEVRRMRMEADRLRLEAAPFAVFSVPATCPERRAGG